MEPIWKGRKWIKSIRKSMMELHTMYALIYSGQSTEAARVKIPRSYWLIKYAESEIDHRLSLKKFVVHRSEKGKWMTLVDRRLMIRCRRFHAVCIHTAKVNAPATNVRRWEEEVKV